MKGLLRRWRDARRVDSSTGRLDVPGPSGAGETLIPSSRSVVGRRRPAAGVEAALGPPPPPTCLLELARLFPVLNLDIF